MSHSKPKTNVTSLDRKINTDSILETTDYELFKFIDCNRSINKAHVDKIVKSMQLKLLDDPIVVNQHMEIVDGQHRFYALRKLELPIRYRFDPDRTDADIRTTNNVKRGWSFQDYLASFIIDEKGKGRSYAGPYTTLDWFKKTYNLPMKICIILLGGSAGTYGLHNFRSGKFKIANLELAKKRAKILHELAKLDKFMARTQFMSAMIFLMRHRDFDIKRFLKVLETKSNSLKGQASRDDYIDNIVKVYNKGYVRDKWFRVESYKADNDEVADDLNK